MIKIESDKKYDDISVFFNDIIMGNNRVISTSNTRKIIAIKKKCNENGSRDDEIGSNPHSNGDLFSRSENDFFEIILRRVIIRIGIIEIKRVINSKIKIIHTIY